MRKPVFGVSDQDRAVKPQKMARGLKFWIQEEKECCYLCRENKALISYVATAQLICASVFAFAKSRYSHDAAQISFFSSSP